MSHNENTTIPEEQPLKDKVEDENKGKTKFQFENKSFIEKLKYVKSNITVEPIMAGLIIPAMFSRLAIQNLNLEKACRVKLGYEANFCDALIRKDVNSSFNFTTNSSTNVEGDVQKIISSIEAWKSVMQTALPTILVIFMGAWSDRTGNRKLCILLPIIGELCVCISNIMSTIFFEEIPVEVTMFLEGIFPAVTGGWVMMYLGVFSYIGDVTSSDDRTFRVGLVNLCMTAGVPLGTALSGILLKLWGYYGIFTLSGIIYALNLTYGIIYIKSNTKPDMDNKKRNPLTCGELVTMVKETAKFPFKKRQGNLRKKLIITLLIVAILYGPSHGERIVFYMYLRYKLKWNAIKFSMFSTYNTITHSLGALFSITVFSKKLGWHDSILCLISIVSKLIGSFYIAFVETDLQMFMLPVIEILNATTWTSLRAMASKLVSSEEMGKMNSVFSLVETLAALLFDPLYSGIYTLTITIFAGTVFVFSGLMVVPAIILLLWIFSKHRKETKQRRGSVTEVETPTIPIEKLGNKDTEQN